MTLALGFFIDCSSPWPSSSVIIFLLISENSYRLIRFFIKLLCSQIWLWNRQMFLVETWNVPEELVPCLSVSKSHSFKFKTWSDSQQGLLTTQKRDYRCEASSIVSSANEWLWVSSTPFDIPFLLPVPF